MYTHTNYRTKKQLVEAVHAYLAARPPRPKEPKAVTILRAARQLEQERRAEQGLMLLTPPRAVTYYQPGPFASRVEITDGHVFIEGPHYPEPHRWYADCTVECGAIIAVR